MQLVRMTKEVRFKNLAPENDNFGKISFLDVKALYDMAFEHKDQDHMMAYAQTLQKAEKLDKAYRAQLAQNRLTRYKQAA